MTNGCVSISEYFYIKAFIFKVLSVSHRCYKWPFDPKETDVSLKSEVLENGYTTVEEPNTNQSTRV